MIRRKGLLKCKIRRFIKIGMSSKQIYIKSKKRIRKIQKLKKIGEVKNCQKTLILRRYLRRLYLKCLSNNSKSYMVTKNLWASESIAGLLPTSMKQATD